MVRFSHRTMDSEDTYDTTRGCSGARWDNPEPRLWLQAFGTSDQMLRTDTVADG